MAGGYRAPSYTSDVKVEGTKEKPVSFGCR